MSQSQLNDGAIREGEPPLPISRSAFPPAMTRREIDRLGILSYTPLVVGSVNLLVKSWPKETRESWPILVPWLLANAVGLIASVWCLLYFLDHLLRVNRHLSKFGKFVWFFLLLFALCWTMPVYWYLYIVRDRLVGEPDAWPGDSAENSRTRQ